MMKLQTFGPAFGQPDASPFCLKAMCLLTMSGVEWQRLPNSDVRKTPFQKLPVLLDDDLIVPDSDNIRYHLQNKTGIDFDEGLTEQQRSQSLAIIRMVEEHLYFCLVYDRWVSNESWEALRKEVFNELPAALRLFVPGIVRRSVISNLKAQGMGRIDYSQMLARAQLDITAIDTFLSNRVFIMGDTPTAADASVASILTSIAASPIQSPLSRLISNNAGLTEYIDRAKVAIFPKQS